MAPNTYQLNLFLPLQVYTKTQVSRLSRELDSLEGFFIQSSVKAANTRSIPQLSLLLNLVFEGNKLNVLNKSDREQVSDFLKFIKEKAPLINISFANDPKQEFLLKIVDWFRKESHSYVLLRVGLQPSIAAGCIIRTKNKNFDLSFKRHFADSKEELISSLREKQQ